MRLKRVRDSLFFISASVNHSQKETTCISQRSHPQMKRRRVLASLFFIPLFLKSLLNTASEQHMHAFVSNEMEVNAGRSVSESQHSKTHSQTQL